MADELPPEPHLRRFLRWCRRLLTPTPRRMGPCLYCGEPTDQHNAFSPDLYRHKDCAELAREYQAAERSRREQIDLFKEALREMDAEDRAAKEKSQ